MNPEPTPSKPNPNITLQSAPSEPSPNVTPAAVVIKNGKITINAGTTSGDSGESIAKIITNLTADVLGSRLSRKNKPPSENRGGCLFAGYFLNIFFSIADVLGIRRLTHILKIIFAGASSPKNFTRLSYFSVG